MSHVTQGPILTVELKPDNAQYNQGDQIGRIFSQLGIVYFKKCLFNYISSPHFCASFVISKDYALILTKHELGYTLGDFFTNSSGNPESNQLERILQVE
jgi:hypothetical protein